ncbi:hypothetical protein [Rhodohalobacter halophilus]|uniref:hypothetical protein n=1 Tax=Rhodohalobacter halophilus TaxID=1812810 RepID=UPI00083F8CBB|nr:hypothetical protein [Rhodohalobacter halophilus]
MTDSPKDSDTQNNLGQEIRLYVEKRIQLISINFAEQISLIVAQSFQKIAGLLILSSALLFLWLGVAFFLSELVQSNALGFLLASLPLFLVGFIFSRTSSKKLTERIQAELITKVMDGVEESIRPSATDQKNQEENAGKE